MAKTPKVKPLTQKVKLDKLKALHIVGPSAKTFGKTAARLWDDYNNAFPKGAKNQTFLRASPAAIKACDSVNMRTIGGAVIFPSGSGGVATLRETKNGVFLDYGQRGQPKYRQNTIILSKGGNHVQYGMKIAKRAIARQPEEEKGLLAFGTLKTHAYNTKKNGTGEMIRGFMRDTAQAYNDPNRALYDDRYSAMPGTLDVGDHTLTKSHLEWLEKTNGVAAMIMVRY